MKSLSHAKDAKDAKASINREKNPEKSFLGERARQLCLCSVCSPVRFSEQADCHVSHVNCGRH